MPVNKPLFLVLFWAALFPAQIWSQENGPSNNDKVTVVTEKPEYFTNAPFAFGGGLLGLGLGGIVGSVVSLPFCIGQRTCGNVAPVILYVGSSLGTALAINAISKHYHLKHRTFWSIIGGFVGNIPLGFYWHDLFVTGILSKSYSDTYAVLSIFAAVVINLIFVYTDSLLMEKSPTTISLNVRKGFSETIFEPCVVLAL